MLAPVGRWKVSGTQGPVFKWECQHLAFTGAVRAWIGHKAANAREHGRKGLNGTVPKREKRWSRPRRQVDSHSEGAPMSLPLAAGSPPSPCPGGEATACHPCRGARSGRNEAGVLWRGGRLSSASGWAAFRGGCGRHADGWGHSGPGRRGALYFEEHYTHRVAIKSKLKDAK